MDASPHLTDRVIVVTGAGGGFGRQLAVDAAARGAKVVAVDINADAVTETVATVTEADGSAAAMPADVTDLDAMKAVAAKTVEEFGALDIMVNNAGIMPLAFYADHAEAASAWHRCIDVNIKGVLNGIIAAHDPMTAQGRGHVVNVSSIYSNYPVAGAAVYGATKAAVDVLSEALRVESQGTIKVTTVKPTGVPATGLSSGVINPAAAAGILGANLDEYLPILLGGGTEDDLDSSKIGYAVLDPTYIVEQIMHVIDQPWGVSISDITIRAAGDRYVI